MSLRFVDQIWNLFGTWPADFWLMFSMMFDLFGHFWDMLTKTKSYQTNQTYQKNKRTIKSNPRKNQEHPRQINKNKKI